MKRLGVQGEHQSEKRYEQQALTDRGVAIHFVVIIIGQTGRDVIERLAFDFRRRYLGQFFGLIYGIIVGGCFGNLLGLRLIISLCLCFFVLALLGIYG